MIDDLVITEARRRLRDAARNEQTSIALNDLLRLSEQENKRLREENESQRFDILAMNQSLDLMREENERLREWIMQSGNNNNECVRSVIGKVCDGCMCGAKK